VTLLDPSLVETLLNMSESDVLDFKRDQYPLAGASDDEKSELVKDVLAFANAWKTDDAHVVIGANENAGARALVVGVGGHLNDADLQQLVNSKTNVPVSFEYLSITVDGLPVGVIRIRKAQERPIFLRRAFGRLRPNVVYVRRGSSTAEADPTEIARMGAASASTATNAPQLSLDLGDPEGRTILGSSAKVRSMVLEERPPPPPMPDYMRDALGAQFALAEQVRAMARTSTFSMNRVDPEKLAAYRKERGLLVRLGFCVKNTGKILVADARVLVEIPKHDGLRVLDELPDRPRGLLDLAAVHSLASHLRPRSTSVDDCGDHWEIDARLGKIQPDATVWSLPFWLGSPLALDLALVARVFGDNIPTPIDVPLMIAIEIQEGWLDDEHQNGDDDADDK
jgi:Schlafen, AlbA_2